MGVRRGVIIGYYIEVLLPFDCSVGYIIFANGKMKRHGEYNSHIHDHWKKTREWERERERERPQKTYRPLYITIYSVIDVIRIYDIYIFFSYEKRGKLLREKRRVFFMRFWYCYDRFFSSSIVALFSSWRII